MNRQMSPVEAEMLLRQEGKKALALATIKKVSVPTWSRWIPAASTGIGAYFLYSMHVPLDFNLVVGLVLVAVVPIGLDQWLQRRRLDVVIRLVEAITVNEVPNPTFQRMASPPLS